MMFKSQNKMHEYRMRISTFCRSCIECLRMISADLNMWHVWTSVIKFVVDGIGLSIVIQGGSNMTGTVYTVV